MSRIKSIFASPRLLQFSSTFPALFSFPARSSIDTWGTYSSTVRQLPDNAKRHERGGEDTSSLLWKRNVLARDKCVCLKISTHDFMN